MEGCVEHDDGEGEDEAGVLLIKDAGVLLTECSCKRLHDSVNLKSLTWQSATEKNNLGDNMWMFAKDNFNSLI